ncbi:MAG: hypothetical protein HZB25_14340 [Candidatus Eisenbacteria bacterium]|nr:hypothetical protein [Candidatus Eisenbacteria bacterium]
MSPDYRGYTYRRPDNLQRGWRPQAFYWQPSAWATPSWGPRVEWSNNWHMGRSGSRWQSMTFRPNRHARAISIRFDNYVVLDRATLWFSSGDMQEVNFGRQGCEPGEYSLIDVDGPWRIRKLNLRARTPYGPTDVTLRYFR